MIFDWDKGAFTKANGTEKYLQTGNTFWRNWATDYCTLCWEEEVLLCDSLSGCLDGICKGIIRWCWWKTTEWIFIQSLTVQLVTIVFINWGLNRTVARKRKQNLLSLQVNNSGPALGSPSIISYASKRWDLTSQCKEWKIKLCPKRLPHKDRIVTTLQLYGR